MAELRLGFISLRNLKKPREEFLLRRLLFYGLLSEECNEG